MSTLQRFVTADDGMLANRIRRAGQRVIYIAPSVTMDTAQALAQLMGGDTVHLTVILDGSADTCRMGYGDRDALAHIHAAAEAEDFTLRSQSGVRIGVLCVDSELLLWAPTARCLEGERVDEQFNALSLSGPLVDHVAALTSADPEHSPVLTTVQVGASLLDLHELKATIDELDANPPVPLDIARRTRVFSTRFQYVEHELKGAEWTQRRIKLASLLLNPDLPDELQDILESQVKPYQSKKDVALPVPHLVQGRPAFNRDRTRMVLPATQSDIRKAWTEILGRYLYTLPGFGSLIRRDRLHAFREETSAFEETLRAWVEAFRAQAQLDEDALVDSVVSVIEGRLTNSARRKLGRDQLKREVREGFSRMRVVKPEVRIVIKDVSFESTRSDEFLAALKSAVPQNELDGWFEEFMAAPQRREGDNQ